MTATEWLIGLDMPDLDAEIMCEAHAVDSPRLHWYCQGENPADYRLLRHCGEISFYCAQCLKIKREAPALWCQTCGHREFAPNVLNIYRRIDPL